MEVFHVRVTSKGQITIPKDLRNKLKVSKGSYLAASLQGGKLVMEPIREKSGKELLLEYAREHGQDRLSLDEADRIYSAMPFAVSEQVGRLREEGVY